MDANTFLYAPTRSITFMKAIILAAYFATLQKLHSVKILTNYLTLFCDNHHIFRFTLA